MGVSLTVNAGMFSSIVVIMNRNSANVTDLSKLGNREGDTADR